MNSQAAKMLFAYWNALRGARLAPDRAEIEPRALAPILGDTFVLEADRAGTLPYRLAGSRIAALFGREMRGRSFLAAFPESDQAQLRRALADANAAAVGLLAKATATDEIGRTFALEIALLPLGHRGRLGARLIGTLAPPEDVPLPPHGATIARLALARVGIMWPALQSEENLRDSYTLDANIPQMPASTRPVLRVIDGGNITSPASGHLASTHR